MSETDFLKLKKHDNVETNTEKFDIDNYLNGNWDKINENAKKVNTDISNINSKNKEQDTNIGQLQENTETSSNKIAELEKELKEAQEDFYQNSIRGQANGEYIHVEDSSNCRAKIKISGNSEQETRSGKNILENSDNNVSQYGLTATIQNDGSVKISGTSTAETTKYLTNIKKVSVDLIKEGNYTISFKNSKNMNDVSIRLRKYNGTDKTEIKNIYLNAINKSEVLNLKSLIDTDTIEIELDVICYGNSEYNFVLYPQLELGEETEYEEYGVMPSPDYPSEIEVVGSNVNLCNGINQEYYLNIYADLCGVISGNTGLIIPITEEKYTISTQISQARYRVACIKEKPIENSSVKAYNGVNKDKTSDNITINTSGYAYLIINATDLTKIKIEKGTVATPWSPYGQGCVKVTKYNKNIFKETYNRKDLTSAYFSIVKGEGFLEKDKTYVISFDTTNNGGIVYLGEYHFQHIHTFTVKCDGTRKFFTAKAKKFGYVTDITVLKSRADTTNAYNISNVMINEYENDTDIDYVQHEEQKYIMPTQKEMLQGDYFDFDNEEEVHVWKKLILTGNENWKLESTGRFGIIKSDLPEIPAATSNNNYLGNMCNSYKESTPALTWKKVQGFCVDMSSCLRIYDDKYSTNNDLEGFKTYLKSQYDAGTPVIIYYKLQTPIRLAFTDEQKAVAKELNNARTYKNVTNITTDSKAILSLDYAKDQETQNQKMQNEIDEIKQLLSTTQTSALLLDNMQTDIESEVG